MPLHRGPVAAKIKSKVQSGWFVIDPLSQVTALLQTILKKFILEIPCLFGKFQHMDGTTTM
jgi:hypothetical protein